MLDHARNEFELSQPQGDGHSLRTHLAAVERHMPQPRLHSTCPPALRHVWGWFVQLHRSRARSDAGPGPIPYSEIAAWSALYRVRPTQWELRVIEQIDNLFLTVIAENRPGSAHHG